jgi:hypothetical protein
LRSVITYDGLPIGNGGAHKLKLRGPTVGWEATEKFLRTCTDFKAPKLLFVEVLDANEIPRSFTAKFKKIFLKKFWRFPKKLQIGDAMRLRWEFPFKKLPELLQLLEEAQPLPVPKNNLKSLMIYLSAEFRFIDPETHCVLPHQDKGEYRNVDAGYQMFLGTSSLRVLLSTESDLNVFFSLPFENATKDFSKYVRFLQDNLPFKFSEKHWKFWTPTKAGTNFIGKKFSIVRA